jgi:glycerol-3-phosphate dehydrogenase (NAD(P)+)
MTKDYQVAVIGLGNWGTALAQHLALKGFNVIAWSRDPQIVNGINKDRKHPLYLKDTSLSERIFATQELNQSTKAPVVIYALPSSSLEQVVPQLSLAKDSILVSAVKGFKKNTLLTPTQYFTRHFGDSIISAVISGPSFAADVVQQKPCGLVAASNNETARKRIAEMFSGNSIRVYTSHDTMGVELGGAVKNVIAVAAGVSDGLGLGESARAGLITRGLAEMMRLAETLGGERLTLTGLSGLGDLIMTATSSLSRNRTLGFRLGKGESLKQIVSSIGSVAEAAETTPLVLELAARQKVELPISQQVCLLLKAEITPAELVKRLLQRPLKSE